MSQAKTPWAPSWSPGRAEQACLELKEELVWARHVLYSGGSGAAAAFTATP